MGLNRWWDKAAGQANRFLETGAFSDVVRNRPINLNIYERGEDIDKTNETTSGCVSSNSCPSGYACVNGVCRRMSASSGQTGGQWPTPGDCDQDDPESPCNSGGPESCQTSPNCGPDENRPARDCCGKRCCSFGSMSSRRPGVNCYCGDCPPYPQECNSFCSGYLAANGEAGPGCSEGSSGNSCSACDYCDNGTCQPKSNTPCFCGEGECDGDCKKCDTDEESPTFGQCKTETEDCQDCASVSNVRCSCGKILPLLPSASR